MTRSILVVLCAWDLDSAGYSTRKPHRVTDNLRVELQVTAMSPFEDVTVTHAQHEEPRGTDTKEEDRKAVNRNGA